VTGDGANQAPTILGFNRAALERGEGELDSSSGGQRLVGCGSPWITSRVLIVNPESREPCPHGKIGEIWVTGPSVTAGYWGNAEATAASFGAMTAQGEGPFLRTGDLGFLLEGKLFVTGRHKDLIIVRGQNHYPHDIEHTASGSHPFLEPQRCAAFSVEGSAGEQLVVVQEVKRNTPPTQDPQEIFRAIRSAISEHHGLHTHAIVLLAPSALPRTSSGKIRRRACQEAYATGSLAALASSVFGLDRGDPETKTTGQASDTANSGETADRLIEWLRRYPGKPGH
jgi:acyl-CoA synthetase (AMP-forming)/AMP-acid ligase II